MSFADQADLFRRQTAELFRLLPASTALAFVGSVLTYAVLFVAGDPARGIYWLAFASGIALFRAVVIWDYSTSEHSRDTARTSATLVVAGNVLAGIQWGLLGTWLFEPEPLFRTIFTAIVVVSFVGGAAITFAPLRFAHAAMAVPAVLPATIYIFFIRADGNVVAGISCLALMAAIMYLAEVQHRIIRARIVLEMEADEQLKLAADQNSTLGINIKKLEHKTEVVKRAQIEARRRADSLSHHMQHTLLPVMECDHYGRIIEWNEAAERNFGFRLNDLTAVTLDNLVTPAESQVDWKSFFASALNRKQATALDAFVRASDGGKIPVRLYITPIDIDGSKATRAAIIATDIPGELAKRREQRRSGNGH
jgi:PAS domain S-box-containing protein